MRRIIERYRITLIVIITLGALASLSLYPRLTINTDFSDYIPSNVGNRANLQKIDSIFGGSEKIVVVLQNEKGILNQGSFDHLENLCNKLKDVEGVDACVSVMDAFELVLDDGVTSFEPLVDEIPDTKQGIDELKQRIANNRMGQRLVASDFSSMAIVVSKSDEVADKVIISGIENVIDESQTDDTIYIGGLSYIRQSIKGYIKSDLQLLLPGGLLLMLIVLFLSFKDWRGVVLPFLIVILSIVFTFGLMALLGWQISIVSILLPIMMIAIANDYSIHLINLYQEKCKKNTYHSSMELVVALYLELKRPIILTALTTIGGMLGLLSHEMPPAAQLGLLASFGIGLALFLSLLLVPAILSFSSIKKSKSQGSVAKASILDKVLHVFTHWVNRFPRRVIGVFIAVSLISVGGLFLIKVDTNIEGYFLGDSKISQSIDIVNNKFGGSQYISILFEGDVLSPEVLNRMETYEAEIKKVDNVGHIISPNTFLKELSKGLYLPNEEGYNQLPKSEAEAEQFLTLLSFGGYDEHVGQLIDFNYEHARILVSMKDGSNRTMKTILNALQTITQNDPNVVCIAGPGLSKIQIADMVINGQISSLVIALIIIFILLGIIFKSVKVGLIGSLPLVLSCLFLFGLMGYTHIPLDIITALLSSIMIGVGVDYTIHFIWRYKEEFTASNHVETAIKTTLETTGRGIVFNAFSVIIGFSILMISNFGPLRFFGVLVVVSISSCLISALLLVPSILKISTKKV
nr:MMPL family transporter [uncultured Carboxylicivirga sp.]